MYAHSTLLSKIAQGDERSFTEAFDCYYARLCFYADKFIHDPDESRSLVQQVFVNLWIKRHKLAIEKSLKAYLYTTVKNYSLDYIKHKLVETKYLHEARPELETYDRDLIEEAEMNARINSAIEELPEKCREIFTLCRFEQLRYNDIAQRLGISIKTVEMQMGIGLKKLRSKLTDNPNIRILLHLFSKKN
jgi:RNA polymerase sigma-70 factor, ECF subfamily